MAPDSATITLPSVIAGDLPSGCTAASSRGAGVIVGSRALRFTS
jgi:hypothetical protein